MITREADQKLRLECRALMELAGAIHELTNEPTKYSQWLTRTQRLVQMLGPEGIAYAAELQRARDPATHSFAIRARFGRGPGIDEATILSRQIATAVLGIIQAIDHAIDNGLLRRVEDLVASEIYADVLDEAEGQLIANRPAVAAILIRIGLENGLRRRALREGMPNAEKTTASALNQWLWKEAQVYPKQTFNSVEGWIAPGNAFAHDQPEKDQYTHAMIAKTLADVRSFLGTQLL